MNLKAQEINLLAGTPFLFVVLVLYLRFYKLRLLSHSLKLCNWTCGVAINSDNPLVKMFVLHFVFFIRLLMYLVIISLKQVDNLTARYLFKYDVSGSRIVLLEYISSFMQFSKEVEKQICNRSYQTAGRKE